MSVGIQARHARACPSRQSGSCNCNPTYQAHAWDAKAERKVRKTFATRTAAKQWRHDTIAGIRAGDVSADRGPLLEDAIKLWLADMRSGVIRNRSGDIYKPGAIVGYWQNLRLRILPTLGDRRMDEVTTRDVQTLIDGLVRDGLAPATIDSALTPLKAFYRRAVARGDARTNPTVGIEKPAVRCKAKRIVAASDARAMIAALDAGERAMWATAFYAGLRRGEMIGLRREDIDLAAGVLHVRRGWDMVEGEIAPKSRQGRRTVPIVGVLRAHLARHLLKGVDDQHVFGAPAWAARTNERARKRWEDRGLSVLTLHEARHNYASFAIAAGMNAKTLSTYMGHANIAITLDLYGHLMPGNEDEATEMMDAYFVRTGAQTGAHHAGTVS
jgi:integrase